MDSYKISMIGLICVFLCLILREIKSPMSVTVKIACALFLFIVALSVASPVIELAKNSAGTSGLSSHLSLLMKALGIALTTELCADICRDCGESALGSGIEFAGKAEILLLSLPLMKQIMEMAEGVMK